MLTETVSHLKCCLRQINIPPVIRWVGLILALLAPGALAVSPPALSLPTGVPAGEVTVTLAIAYTIPADHAYYTVALTGVPAGTYSVANGTYMSWCVSDTQQISMRTAYKTELYSSYSPVLSQVFTNYPVLAGGWNELNYIINNKLAYAAAPWNASSFDIQNAIWLVMEGASTDPSASATAIAVANDAMINGATFVPTAGQNVAVLCDFAPPWASSKLQDVVIEVPVPGTPTVTIGDFVWQDSNGNGVQDAGEPGIANVALTLNGTSASGGTVTDHTVTGSYGQYSFNEPPGTYTVSVDAANFLPGGPLAGYVATVTGQGTTANDSNSNPSGTTPASLTGGGSDVTVDFGFYQPVTIGDYVWNDANANGIQDDGGVAAGIAGVTLTLTGTTGTGAPVTDHATTTSAGYYQFSEAPGTYTVSVDAANFTVGGALAGYTATLTGQGTTASDSNVNPSGTTPAALASGGSDETLDFGFYQGVTIGNFVWNDLNGNGVQDAGEPGVPNVTLTLTGTTAGGQAVTATTTTDANGLYQFTEPPGTYTVTVTTPAGYTPTATGKGTPATDSNVTPSTTTLAEGGSDQSIDFGFYQPVTVGNYVWNDANANGVQDGNETGIANVPLTLSGTDGAGNTVHQTTATDASGQYQFTVPPGTYTVSVTTPAGYVPTLTGKGTAATDSNPSPSGTTPGTLASGGSDQTVDFGFYQPVTIGDYVWNDANGNGIQDDGGAAAGIANVGLTLTGTTASGTAVTAYTMTDANGKYGFTEAPGTYTVSVDATNFDAGAPLAGYMATATGKGGNAALDSNGSPSGTTPTALAEGGSDATLDFGFVKPVTIGNSVWNDLNGNGVQDVGEPGIPNVTVMLTGTDAAGDTVNATATTDANGLYQFTELPGTYTVSVTTPAGYVPTATGQGTTATDSNASPSSTTPTALTEGQTDQSVDFGFYQPVTIGDYVWNDANANGIQDDGGVAAGIAGVTLTLTGTTGTGAPVTDHATTTSAGYYQFSEAPGTYTVSVDAANFTVGGALAGYTATLTGQGTTASDSNVNPSGTTPAALASGGSDETLDFGFYQGVTIGNFVWNDLNGNGVQDAGEPGVPNVTLTLTGTTAGGQAVTATTTTDANGLYQFTEPPGTYTVTVTTPAGYTPTATGKGTPATDSNVTPSTTTLAEGGSDQSIDFGFYQPVTVGNYVWNDANANGVQDGNETGIANVPLTLSGTDGAGNTVHQTTATDASGQYQFTVPPGTYTVSVTTPAGYVPTLTGKGTAATDSNPSPGGTTPGTLASGGSDQTVDFGFYQPVTIGDYVWVDTNGNGVQDLNEPGIADVGVMILWTNAANVVTTNYTTTDNTGHYQFTEAPGTYGVMVNPTNFLAGGPLVGYVATATGQGTAATDSNASPSATTVAEGGSDLTVDFGFYKPVTIGDFVWNDANANGIQEIGEAGIAGVTLTLTGTDGTGHAVNATTTTDTTGHYLFTEAPGTYTVSVSPPSGYTPTLTGQGTTATDSNPSPSGTTPATLASGASDLTVDFGFYQAVTIGDYVWYDVNDNGIQDANEPGIPNVALTLTGTAAAGATITAHTTTDSSGRYQFVEPPGSYAVSVDSSNFQPGGPLSGDSVSAVLQSPAGTGGGTGFGGGGTTVPIPNGGHLSLDFGYYQPVTIGHYVWLDTNGNGIQDATESGIPNVGLTLIGTDVLGNAVTNYLTTDDSGFYYFTENPGTYKVSVDATNFLAGGPLAGLSPSPVGQGTNPALDSNPSPSGTVPPTLLSAASDLNLNFGYYKAVTVGDFVWLDKNANGIQDANEPGIANVGLTLIGSNSDGLAITNHATTDSTGHYQFTEPPGTYTVSVDATNILASGPLADLGVSPTGQGTNPAVDSNSNPTGTTPSTLLSGGSDLTLDFGYYPLLLTLAPQGVCAGSPASLSVVVNNGQTPLTYQWLKGQAVMTDGGTVSGSSSSTLTISSTASTDQSAYTVLVTDARGASATATASLTVFAHPAVFLAETDANCFGGNDGTVTATISGGTAPYWIALNNGTLTEAASSTVEFANLPAGSYTVMVQDSHNCSATALVSVGQPTAALSLGLVETDASCFGGSDGTVTATFGGGTAGTSGYQVSLDGGAAVAMTSPHTFSGLSSGSHTVKVTDAHSCTMSQLVTVNQPTAALSLGLAETDVNCYGGSDGTVTATFGGGTAGTSGYQVSLDGGAPVAVASPHTFSGLSSGSHTVKVTDAHSCTTSQLITVNQPTAALNLGLAKTDVNCFGGSDGTVTATFGGGTAGTSGYQVSLDGGAAVAMASPHTFSGLSSGSHTVKVTDAHSCTTSQLITVSQPTAALTLGLAETDVNCYNGTDGTVTATFGGGTSAYQVSLDGGAAVAMTSPHTFSGLSSGSHTVKVTDAHSCTTSQLITVSQPTAALTLGLAETDVNCNGGSDGTVTATFGGGTSAYQVSLDGGAAVAMTSPHTFSGLSSGSHTVKVTDAHSCTMSQLITVNQPTAALSLSLAETDVNCYGGNDGTVTATFGGGTSAYQVSLDGGAAVAMTSPHTFSGLSSGSHTVKVTDAHSCTTSQLITVNQPTAALNLGLAKTDVNCFGGSDGTVTATFGGGTAGTSGYQVSLDGGAAVAMASPHTFSGLSSGSHTVKVTDAHSCTTSQLITVSQPTAALTLGLAETDVNCNGGSDGTVTATFGGGTSAYQVSLDGGAAVAMTSPHTFSSLAYGSHTVKVTDAHGCTASQAITVNQPTTLTLALTETDAKCYGGSDGTITATFSGGTSAYQVSLDGGTAVTMGSPHTFTGLSSGSHTVKVTDAHGCTTGAQLITVSQPAAALTLSLTDTAASAAGNDGTVTATFSGGTSPYTVSINGGTATTSGSPKQFAGLTPGSQTVLVTDAHGCTISQSITVSQTCPTLTHSAYTDFNSTPSQQPTTLWLNVHTKLSGQLAHNGDYVWFTAANVVLGGITASWKLAVVPDGIIIATNAVTQPTTVYDTVAGLWVTEVPLAYSSSDIFISGAILTSTTGFTAGSGKDTVVTGQFYSDISGFSSSWFYGLACYQPNFDYTSIGLVDAIATGGVQAGTPVAQESEVVAGGSGGGGSNFTGSYSATDSYTACTTTTPLSTIVPASKGVPIILPTPISVGVPPGANLGCNPTVFPTLASIESAVVVTDTCPTIKISVVSADSGTACASNRIFTVTVSDTCGNTVVSNVVYTWRYDKTPPTILGPANTTIVTNLPASPWYCTFADSDWSSPCGGTNWWSWCNQTYLNNGWWNTCNWNNLGGNWSSYVGNWVNNGACQSWPCNGRNPGCILTNYFGSVYTNRCVQIGATNGTGYCLKFTSTDAIRSCLGNAGTAAPLSCSATNPTTCSAGQFCAKVLALRLNVDYGDCGGSIGFASPCRNFVLNDSTSPCNGKTVGQILDIANCSLGGCTTGVPAGCTVSYLCGLVDNLNRCFQGCQLSYWGAGHLTAPSPAPAPSQTGYPVVTDNCDSSPTVTYSDSVASGSCPGSYIVTRTWTAVDSCGNTSTSNQTIALTPPGSGTSISGMVALDVTDDGQISGDPGLAGVTVQLKNYRSVVVATTNTDVAGNYSFGNLAPGTYTIVVVPPAHYVESVDPDYWMDNQTTVNLSTCKMLSGINFGYAATSIAVSLPLGGDLGCNPPVLPSASSVQAQVSVNDVCPNVNINVTSAGGGTACASNLTFTITVTDTCGNSLVTNLVYTWRSDKTPPTIVGPANLTIVTNLSSAPWYCTFADNDWSSPCGGTNWWSWCNQTYLNNGWWNTCNWNQIGGNWSSYVGNWVNNGACRSWPCNGRNPGCILTNYFCAVYTNRCVQVGATDGSGYCLTFTSTDAIRSCLANTGAAAPLACSSTNPTTCAAGQFGAKVLALRLNVDYGDCGGNIGFAAPCRNFVLNDSTSPCNGNTVGQILDIANRALGGCTTGVPAGCTVNYLCGLVDNLNRSFQGCQLSYWGAGHLVAPSLCPAPAQTGSPTVTDNCDPNPVVTYSDSVAAGSCAGSYIVTRTWTAVDSCGNTSTSNQTISLVAPGSATSISGMVAIDSNDDHCINGDPGFAGITVELNNSKSVIIATTNTDVAGNYSFGNLSAGLYTVVVVPPAHYTQTVDPDSSLDNQTTVNLSTCQILSGLNFGYTGTSPALSLAVTGPASAICGQTVTFTIAVTNTGDASFSGGVQVSDSLFGGQIFCAPLLAPGQGFLITTNHTIQPTDPATLVSTITAVGNPPIGNAITNVASWTTAVTQCITLGCANGTGQVGVAYSSSFPASGGTPPFNSYTIVAGSLPTGLTLSATTGALTGTPGAAGTFNFTVQVKDSKAVSDTSVCSITIAPACVSGPASFCATPRYGSCVLTWNTLSGCSSYNVKRGTCSGGPYTTVQSGLSSGCTSYSDSSIANGNTYYYVVTGIKGGLETCNSTESCATPGTPAPWNCQDVGSVGAAGGSYCSSGTFTVSGCGADIWGSNDAFQYAYQPASGDCSIVARVTGVQGTDPWAKAGVMIRETLNNNATHCSVFVTPGNGAAFQCRTSTGGSTTMPNNPACSTPYWVKAVRTGNTFTTYCSSNGSSWTQLGSQTINMGANTYIGVCVTSHNPSSVCTATFDNVTATP